MCPEHLIAIALETGRAKDKARVSLLMEQAGMDESYLNSMLERYNLEGKLARWTE